MHSCGKFWAKRYKKDKKTQQSFLKSWEQKLGVRSKIRVLHIPPPKGRANCLSHPSSLMPGQTSTCSQPGVGCRKPVTCFHSLLQLVQKLQ